jgi:drug/metabolite transporter (DMT)-like permease
MPTWILIVIVAQFLYAIAAIIDKFIITSKKVSKPFIYAFFVTLLSVIPILLFALGTFNISFFGFILPTLENVSRPTLSLISMTLVSAFAGFNALVSLYSALREADASDVIPVIGSVSAVGTLLLSYLVLDDVLTDNFLIALGFFLVGTVLISRLRFNKKVLMLTLHAGLLFALKATVVKKMFVDTNFDQAFFWSRIGIIIFIVSLLLVPRYLGKITVNTKKTKTSGGIWVVGNAILGGLAAYITLKAIDLGNVTIVQALGGLQFVFLILISFFFGRMIPATAGENNTIKDIIQKVFAVSFMIIGFYFLFI